MTESQDVVREAQPESDELPVDPLIDQGLSSFVVVLKASSSVRVPHGQGARFVLGTDNGSAEVRVLTNWAESGFQHPVPRELWIDVRLEARSIDQAIDQARMLASAVAPVVAFTTNAGIGAIEPHIAFDFSSGVTERAFVEYFVPDERGLVPQSRAGDPDVIVATANAAFHSQHWKAIATTLAHYFAALGHYHVGGESLAVGHLFMAAEALRESSLAKYCETRGLSESEIMTEQGLERRGLLLAWARRELVFGGDRKAHQAAKDASDGLEHGFKTVSEVHASAEPVCDKTFEYVRRAIVDLLEVTDAVRDALLTKFGTPADTQSLRRRVTGVLIGNAENLAAPGREYPILEWNSSIASFDIAADGAPTLNFRDRFTVRTAESVSFQAKSMEIYGRSRPGNEPQLGEIEILTPEDATSRDRILPVIKQVTQALAACGPGEQGAEFPLPLTFLLELFNRTKGLNRACLSLLDQALPEEALIVGRALVRDGLRLKEAADSGGEIAKALAFGWKYDSVTIAAHLLGDAPTIGLGESQTLVDERQNKILEAARRFGVEELRSFADATDSLMALEDDDFRKIDSLAEAIDQGWDIATRSRTRTSPDGGFGLHDTAPNSWVYPFAAKFIGGGSLIAARAALQLFAWDDPQGQVAAAGRALVELETSLVASMSSDV